MPKYYLSFNPLFSYLQDYNISLRSFAKLAGISVQTLCRMKHPGYHVSTLVLCKICSVLDCNLEFICRITFDFSLPDLDPDDYVISPCPPDVGNLYADLDDLRDVDTICY